MNRGIAFALSAYVIWGVFPLYIKALKAVPAIEILAHRMVWSLAFVRVVLIGLRRTAWLFDLIRDPRQVARFAASATLITVNWGVYIWAVNAGHVVDASLGYFINPLVNVLIGAVFLRERLRPVQWGAVACAAAGVLWLTWDAGHLPWIGLTLALAFSGYGLLRRSASLGAIEGLAVETVLLFPLALGYLLWLGAHGSGALANATPATWILLIAAGPATAIPLMLFAAGARRISFSLLGLLQYVGPSLQLALGVWVFGEPFDGRKLIGYGAIWLGLLILSVDSLWNHWRSGQSGAAAGTQSTPKLQTAVK